ncbi:hypothetical protein AAFC00_005117 [Neodothiora populina]
MSASTRVEIHHADPGGTAQTWLDRFSHVLNSKDIPKLGNVFHEDCWWRDHLSVQWDLRTIHGLQNISEFLTPHLDSLRFDSPKLSSDQESFPPSVVSPIEGLEWVQSMFSFETAVGRGTGLMRLAQGSDGVYKAHMLYTALDEIKGHEENIAGKRPLGGKNSLEGGIVKGNWLERRQRMHDFADRDPQVLILGAGQAGLNLAARLQALDVSCLIVDREQRIGDNWRQRYRTLVTHDPVTYCHMSYLPFPTTWPLFTPKDKLGDWFEAYASLMELSVWLSTTVASSTYSESSKDWNVTVRRDDGSERNLKPHHIVLCTGHSGEPHIPDFAGQDTFNGVVYHGSQHKDASDHDVSGKRVIVVGTGNSGHDIAQNFYENGAASVTMLQRSGTYVMNAEIGGHMLHEGLYDETGPPTKDADIFSQSLPLPVQFALGVGLTQRIKDKEKDLLDGLAKAGFDVDFGHDGSGLFRKYMTRGGGYYLDVGASELICQGKIKLVQCEEGIEGFEPDSLVLKDGRKLNADIVVLATGYDNMRTSARKILGDAVADRAKDVWDLDQEGELNAMWRPSGHPRFWYNGGNLALCRIYSKFLALQIKAVEAGLNKDM